MQDLELVAVADQERDALGAEQRLVADLLDVEDVGHRHEAVADGAQVLRPLEAELAAGFDGDLDGAVRRLLDLVGEAARVLGVEVRLRPDGREVPLDLRRGRDRLERERGRAEKADDEVTSCEHVRSPVAPIRTRLLRGASP